MVCFVQSSWLLYWWLVQRYFMSLFFSRLCYDSVAHVYALLHLSCARLSNIDKARDALVVARDLCVTDSLLFSLECTFIRRQHFLSGPRRRTKTVKTRLSQNGWESRQFRWIFKMDFKQIHPKKQFFSAESVLTFHDATRCFLFKLIIKSGFGFRRREF